LNSLSSLIKSFILKVSVNSFSKLRFEFDLVKLFTPFGHEARTVKVFMAEGYCVKCKAKREIADGVEETMKNGRKAIKGKCPVCGTVMFKILGGKAAPAPTPTNPPATS
jgi:Zn finger protein HypA/HybF involved in hydrogenase expression